MTANDKKALILAGKCCAGLIGLGAIAAGTMWWIDCGNYVFGGQTMHTALRLRCIGDANSDNVSSCYCAINHGIDKGGALEEILRERGKFPR